MKKYLPLLVLIITTIAGVRAEQTDYENFRPTPGTETNPLLNVDFYTTGVSAFYFYNPGLGNPPSFRHYIGYTAEYADGTIETDSIGVASNQAVLFSPSTTFYPALVFHPEKTVYAEEEFYIDEDSKSIVVNLRGLENVWTVNPFWLNDSERFQRLIDGIRSGKKRTEIYRNGSGPDIDDISYSFIAAGIYDLPTFSFFNQPDGFIAETMVYDENGDYVALAQMTTVVFKLFAYMKEFHTVSQPDIVQLIDWFIDYSPLGQAYGADETIKTEGAMTLKYHDYTIKCSQSSLSHIYFTDELE